MGFSASEISKMKFEHLALRKPWLDIVGKPSSNSSILMYSRPGSGKSSIALQLADELTRHGVVGFMAAEEGISPTLQDKLERLNLMNTAIQFYEPDNLEDIKAFALREKLDALFVDSFTVFDKKLRLFEEFRLWAKQNEIFFVTIVQTTKDGKFYGNADAAFNVDCVLQVIDGKPSTEATGKNRLGELYEHDTDLRAKPVKPVPEKEAKRVNPELIRFNPVDEDLLHGLEYIENPEEYEDEFRENRGVSPEDIYDTITKGIIELVNSGDVLPWRKPWRISGYVAKQATNFISNKGYRGINFFLLNFTRVVEEKGERVRILKGLTNPYFFTFKQIEKLGGKLRKGSIGQPAFYFTRLYKYEQEDPKLDFGTYDRNKMIAWVNNNRSKINEPGHYTAEQIADYNFYPILKYYNLFNGEDIEGIDYKTRLVEKVDVLSEDDRIATAQLIYDTYPKHPPLKFGGNRAAYSPSKDIIMMPEFSSFESSQSYYTTLYHEAVHSTGHEKRLKRDLTGAKDSDKYAFEELIAELGAVILSGEAGILFATKNNSASYLKHWNSTLVKNMEENNKFFFRATSRAQAAADYIFDLNDEGVPAYRAKLAETLAIEAKKDTKKKAKGKKPPSAEKVKAKPKAKSFKEFQKESPVLWGHITVNGNTKFGQFKVKHNKYTNKAEYTYYTEKGNRGTGGFTFAKAFSLYNDKKLTESRSDWLDVDKPKIKASEKTKYKLLDEVLNEIDKKYLSELFKSENLSTTDFEFSYLLKNKPFIKDVELSEFIPLVKRIADKDNGTSAEIHYLSEAISYTSKSDVKGNPLGATTWLIKEILTNKNTSMGALDRRYELGMVDKAEDKYIQSAKKFGTQIDKRLSSFNDSLKEKIKSAVILRAYQVEYEKEFDKYKNKSKLNSINASEKAMNFILNTIKNLKSIDGIIEAFDKPQLELRLNGTDETLIYLGSVEKLDVDSPYTAGLEGSGLRMFSNQAQNKLYIIPQELVKAAKFKVDDSKASNLFKEWHNYAADHKDLEISYPSTSKKEKIGTASKIWYRSDKVMQPHDKKGKQNYYVHDFDANKRPVYVQGSVMIIENIKWNERGILN